MAEAGIQTLRLQAKAEGRHALIQVAYSAGHVTLLLRFPALLWQRPSYCLACSHDEASLVSRLDKSIYQRTCLVMNLLPVALQTRVNATKLQRQDTIKIKEKRKQKEQAEADSEPVRDSAIREAERNGDGPLVLPDFTPLSNGNRCLAYTALQQFSYLYQQSQMLPVLTQC